MVHQPPQSPGSHQVAMLESWALLDGQVAGPSFTQSHLVCALTNLTDHPSILGLGKPLDFVQEVALDIVRVATISLDNPLVTPVLLQLPDRFFPGEAGPQ